MRTLVFNAGSSTLKFSLFVGDNEEASASGVLDWKGGGGKAEVRFQCGDQLQQSGADIADHGAAVRTAVELLVTGGLLGKPLVLDAIGQRIVHGGAHFRESVRVDRRVKAVLAKLVELAPLHNPPALRAIEAAENALPGIPQVAVFDTSFHRTLPPAAFVYPAPWDWYADWGIRRFGFHGISFAYCTGRAAELLGRPVAELRLVICHLGNGCSAVAVRGGQSVATTMGFTPLEGLMMGSRSGSLDPGVVFYLQRRHGMSADQVDQALNHSSGLLGVSGLSSDFREVESAAQQGHERARLALDIYAGRVRAAVGALAVTLGGVDALVFTAGVGENSATLRAAACEGLECLGLRLDGPRNAHCRPDTDVAGDQSPGRILVLHTREELLIAREARRVVEEGNSLIH